MMGGEEGVVEDEEVCGGCGRKKKAGTGTVVLLDGGMGHELKRRLGTTLFGGGGSACVGEDESISTATAKTVLALHEEYIDAGCHVVTTNTFMSTPAAVGGDGVREAVQGAVSVAKKAVEECCRAKRTSPACVEEDGKKKVIAGSVPPLGKCYDASIVPSTPDSLVSPYCEVIYSMLHSSSYCVDLLLAETLSSSVEAKAVILALRRALQRLSIANVPDLWISFTIVDEMDSNKCVLLRSGEKLEDAIQSIFEFCKKESVIDDENFDGSSLNSLAIMPKAILVNCCHPIAAVHAIKVMRRERSVADGDVKIGCYANAFKTTTSTWLATSTWLSNHDQTSDERSSTAIATWSDREAGGDCEADYDEDGVMLETAFAKYALRAVEEGADIIGGCCGTTPSIMQYTYNKIKEKQ